MSNNKKKGTYYDRNAEQIKKERKQRYHNEPDFRQACLENIKTYRHRKRQERKALKEAIDIDRKVWRVFKVGKDKLPVKCCRVGYLAASIGRTAQTIRLWEKEGRFPKSIRYKDQRYYTKPHYNFILRIWRKHKDNLKQFLIEVNRGWEDVKLK